MGSVRRQTRLGLSSEGLVPGDEGVPRVEVHFGLGNTDEAAVTPPDLYMANYVKLLVGDPITYGGTPGDFRLPSRSRCDRQRSQLKSLVPIPGRCDPQPKMICSLAA